MRFSKLLIAVVFLLLASITYATPIVLDLNKVCSSLTSVGFSSGTWKKSNIIPKGWVCSNMGAAVEFGLPGPLGLPSNVSYFVVGSGKNKLDNAQLKLNVNNVSSFPEGKRKLIQATRLVLANFGEKPPAGFEESLSKVNPKIRKNFNGKESTVVVYKSKFLGYSFVVSQTNSRLTSVLVTIRSNTSSKLWE
jgi:hypothetical protein